MTSANILIRVQSPMHGTKRIEAKSTQPIDDFISKVRSEFGLPLNGWKLWLNRERTSELRSTSGRGMLSAYKLHHGDMLYLDIETIDDMSPSSSINSLGGGLLATDMVDISKALPRDATGNLLEDDVDVFLWKQNGKIERARNEQLCHHGPLGKCLHCVPYEPYDEEYLANVNPPIKFLSFHSYLRKLTGGVDKGKFAMLENVCCKIKPGCREHPPWPGGICTKCQPNAITLQRQKYRHVDYIQFENHVIVERFLDYWRKTGNQRMGYLYGHYEPHKDTPLGIRAVVSAIYEPLQIGSKMSIELVQDEDATVNEVAAKLGLRKVGWIFTDLVPLDMSIGSVKHFRGNVNSHFLSAEELIMAAELQNRHPNTCRLSPEGHFGSKFVTVVVTGDAQNQIHFEGYQVSNQCMALVRDDCLVPTRDAPELGYFKESTNEQYVPDVFYKVNDEYGNEVTQLARPLPVEYLLVDLPPPAFPKELAFTFHVNERVQPFPIEHHDDQLIGETQEFGTLTSYLHQFPRERFLQALSDFHVLVYMASCDILPLKDHMDSLLEAVSTKSEELLHHFLKTEVWGTLEQLMDSEVPQQAARFDGMSTEYVGRHATPLPAIGQLAGAPCTHCTYLNRADADSCEMCGLPVK